jgi:hypothetical protein
MTKFCSQCGAQVNGAKFCPECGHPTGTRQPAEILRTEPHRREFTPDPGADMQCPNGHHVQSGATYCQVCGAGLTSAAPPMTATSQAERRTGRRTRLIVVFTLLIAAIASLAIAGVVVLANRSEPSIPNETKAQAKKAIADRFVILLEIMQDDLTGDDQSEQMVAATDELITAIKARAPILGKTEAVENLRSTILVFNHTKQCADCVQRLQGAVNDINSSSS